MGKLGNMSKRVNFVEVKKHSKRVIFGSGSGWRVRTTKTKHDLSNYFRLDVSALTRLHMTPILDNWVGMSTH